jgi:uncharacterized UPF0160 family protein
MEIKALIENLQALSDTLKANSIRESESFKDFTNCVERFEGLLSDLVVVSRDDIENAPTAVKKKLAELSEVLIEIDKYCDHQSNVLKFVSQIAPHK